MLVSRFHSQTNKLENKSKQLLSADNNHFEIYQLFVLQHNTRYICNLYIHESHSTRLYFLVISFEFLKMRRNGIWISADSRAMKNSEFSNDIIEIDVEHVVGILIDFLFVNSTNSMTNFLSTFPFSFIPSSTFSWLWYTNSAFPFYTSTFLFCSSSSFILTTRKTFFNILVAEESVCDTRNDCKSRVNKDDKNGKLNFFIFRKPTNNYLLYAPNFENFNHYFPTILSSPSCLAWRDWKSFLNFKLKTVRSRGEKLPITYRWEDQGSVSWGKTDAEKQPIDVGKKNIFHNLNSTKHLVHLPHFTIHWKSGREIFHHSLPSSLLHQPAAPWVEFWNIFQKLYKKTKM